MATADEIDASLERLTAAIPPPAHPLGLDIKQLPADLPLLPADLFRFAAVYGSGFFDDGSVFLAVLNPYEDGYWRKQNRDLQLVREFKEEEGDDYIPYDIYPQQPGLFLWGYGQDRKHFFWLTEGQAGSWPVVVMYDIEIFTRFATPMVRFLEQLLCGDLDCSFIGHEGCLDPGSLRFAPRILPA